LDVVEILNLDTLLWEPGPPLPGLLKQAASAQVNDGTSIFPELSSILEPFHLGTFAITGGIGTINETFMDDIFVYRGQINGWETLPVRLEVARGAHAAVAVNAEDYCD